MASLPYATTSKLHEMLRDSPFPEDIHPGNVFRMLALAPPTGAAALGLIYSVLTETELDPGLLPGLPRDAGRRPVQDRHADLQHRRHRLGPLHRPDAPEAGDLLEQHRRRLQRPEGRRRAARRRHRRRPSQRGHRRNGQHGDHGALIVNSGRRVMRSEPTTVVMPGLDPGIHALLFLSEQRRGWPGQARP